MNDTDNCDFFRRIIHFIDSGIMRNDKFTIS